MKRFWKNNLYISLVLFILYLLVLFWDMYIKKGNSSFGEVLFLIPVVCIFHLLFQIVLFIVRFIKKHNNQYSFITIILTFVFIVIQIGLLFIILGSTSVSDW